MIPYHTLTHSSPSLRLLSLPSFTGIHIYLAFFETRQPGRDVRKDTCPDKILLARSKLCNNIIIRYSQKLKVNK